MKTFIILLGITLLIGCNGIQNNSELINKKNDSINKRNDSIKTARINDSIKEVKRFDSLSKCVIDDSTTNLKCLGRVNSNTLDEWYGTTRITKPDRILLIIPNSLYTLINAVSHDVGYGLNYWDNLVKRDDLINLIKNHNHNPTVIPPNSEIILTRENSNNAAYFIKGNTRITFKTHLDESVVLIYQYRN